MGRYIAGNLEEQKTKEMDKEENPKEIDIMNNE